MRRAGIEPEIVDTVIMGQAYQNGEYVNVARMALLKAGWPETVPGVTLDSRCCTGLEVVRYAAALISSGQAEIVVAGGTESMSNAEFYLPGSVKWGIGGSKGMPKGHGDLSSWGIPLSRSHPEGASDVTARGTLRHPPRDDVLGGDRGRGAFPHS